jgi:hypothetical protein
MAKKYCDEQPITRVAGDEGDIRFFYDCPRSGKRSERAALHVKTKKGNDIYIVVVRDDSDDQEHVYYKRKSHKDAIAVLNAKRAAYGNVDMEDILV